MLHVGSQVGPTTTYMQTQSHRKCRIDVMGIPLAWAVGSIQAWVMPEIHVALACPDHTATCVSIELLLATPVSRRDSQRLRLPASAVTGECCSHRAGGSQPMRRLPSWFSICNSAWAASPITRNRSLAMCISQQTLGLCNVPLPVGAGRFTGSRCTREPKFSPSASRLGRGLGALIAPMKVLLLTSGCFMPRYLS